MSKERDLIRRRLEAPGLSIDYLEAGHGNPLLVFPAEDADSGDSILAKLAESHRVIRLNLPSRDYAITNQLIEKLTPGLASLGIQQCSVIGIAAGARAALALALAAPERIDRLILISPLQVSGDAAPLDLAGVKTATLVLVGTRDTSAAIEAARRCREKISSCHLSFVYGVGHGLAGDRPEACLDAIAQFLEQGEQFIIFHESQMIRP
jgi:pimeloyl-ACP methyl ester carboxylesterase